jgi:hypothetical protein
MRDVADPQKWRIANRDPVARIGRPRACRWAFLESGSISTARCNTRRTLRGRRGQDSQLEWWTSVKRFPAWSKTALCHFVDTALNA